MFEVSIDVVCVNLFVCAHHFIEMKFSEPVT